MARCIKVYCKEELRQGKSPWKHVVKLVEAFNKSEIGRINPNLEILVDNIIMTLEDANGINRKTKPIIDSRRNKSKNNRHNLIFQNSSKHSYSRSQEFSFTGEKSQQKTLKNSRRDFYGGEDSTVIGQKFESQIISEIEQLNNGL